MRRIDVAVVYRAGVSVQSLGELLISAGAGNGRRSGAAASDAFYSGNVVPDPGPPPSCSAVMWRPSLAAAGKHHRPLQTLPILYRRL